MVPRTRRLSAGRQSSAVSERGNSFRLSDFRGDGYSKGRPLPIVAMWFAVEHLIFMKWWCPSRLRVALLRAFGATIGEGVLIRHGVRVHWPWKLTIGDHAWIGEGAWILNLEPVTIGRDSVLSQESLLCTGSHDRRSPSFEFDNASIAIGDSVWIAARATVLRGVTIGDGVTVASGVVACRDLPAGTVLRNPFGSR